MKKFFIQSILLLIVVFGALYFFFSSTKNITGPSTFGQRAPQNSIIIRGIKINVELADTTDKRRKGLGGRESLASDSGMLFIFEKEGVQTFWMKELKFPLDFIWIRSNKIVDITKNALPPALGVEDSELPIYVPREPVTKVLEVNGGFVDANGIKVGDIVEVP